MLRAFDDLVRQGKILYTACSNYEAWRLMEALWLSDSNGWARFDAYQPQYSLVVRDIDEEIVPACAGQGAGPRRVVAARRRLPRRQVHAGQPQGRGHALGRRLGLQQPLLRAQPRRDPADAARHRARDRPLAGADALRWVMDQPYIDQRHRRRAQRPAARRDAGARAAGACRRRRSTSSNKVSAQPHRYPRAFEESMVERRNSAIKMPGARVVNSLQAPAEGCAMGRNIVVCCDGTANQFSQDNTNVVKLYSALVDDAAWQLIFYHPGVGTMGSAGARSPAGAKGLRSLPAWRCGYGLGATSRPPTPSS